ncbi:WD40 repeat-like protein [Amanita rubescens]|nr:WD40 repeat-like protein [Amanita rubescens]
MSNPMQPHFFAQRSLNVEDYGNTASTTVRSVLKSLDAQVVQYVPILSPPTPAPSPGPSRSSEGQRIRDLSYMSLGYPIPPRDFPLRRQYLFEVLKSCTPSELLYISTSISPRLKRDFLHFLPVELAIHILGFIDDPRTLARVAQVSKYWNTLMHDEFVWKRMCIWNGFDDWSTDGMEERNSAAWDPVPSDDYAKPKLSSTYRHFKLSYTTMMNWRHGGQLLRSHRMPVVTPNSGVVTSLAIDNEWVIVGLTNSRIHVFSAQTGVLHRTLVGHESEVWGVCLVSRGGHLAAFPTEPGLSKHRTNTNDRIHGLNSRLALGVDMPNVAQSSNVSSSNLSGSYSDQCYASKGWGQPNALVVSGGCDRVLRVWDIESGLRKYELRGHTSTIRCIRVLDNRPIVVTGSRDATLRVWDIHRGEMLRVLEGHTQSVRCSDVSGNKVVSGSYDTTCRLWNIDTGECLHVLSGHSLRIHSVAFNGVRIASGGLDTTVRVWDANTGQCLALLQGHKALVCQLQLSPTILATGGSDGHVIIFCLKTNNVLHRIAAHDSSVTSLQFDDNFLVTGGKDGRVRLFETQTGNPVRELNDSSERVWKVAYTKETCAIMCKRAGHTVMEVWSM